MTTQTKQTYPEPVRIAKAWKLCQQGWSRETIRQLFELSPHNLKFFAVECVERAKHIYNNSDFVKKHPEHAEAVNNAIKTAKGNNKKEQQKAARAACRAGSSAAYAAAAYATRYAAAQAATYAAARVAYYAADAADADNTAYDAAINAYIANITYDTGEEDPGQKAWQLQRLMVYMLDEKPSQKTMNK